MNFSNPRTCGSDFGPVVVLGRHYSACRQVCGDQADILPIAFNEDDEIADPRPIRSLGSDPVTVWCPAFSNSWEPGGLMTTWFAMAKAGKRDDFAFHPAAMSAGPDCWVLPKLPSSYRAENDERISRCFHAMSDSDSCRTFLGALAARTTSDAGAIPIAPYPQYFHPAVRLQAGETVYEGGIEDGYTTSAFVEVVGNQGRVVAFEPVSAFCDQLDDRFRDQPNVRIERVGLWDVETEATISMAGGGSRVGEPGQACKLIRVDDYVTSGPSPNFLKLDIEGAELPALIGAEKTIRQSRPKLAIAVYHQPVEQFIDIIDWLIKLDVGYSFWLGHHSPLAYETVLYASASEPTC